MLGIANKSIGTNHFGKKFGILSMTEGLTCLVRGERVD